MDEITQAFKLARAHFDNIPVTNPWALRWSRAYFVPRLIPPFGESCDSIGMALQLGRRFDGHRINQWLPRDMWKWPLTKTKAIWQRPKSQN